MTVQTPGQLVCPIHWQAVSNPQAIALMDKDTSLSYRQLDTLITSITRQLSEKGVLPSTRIGLHLAPSIEYIILLFALVRLQCIAVAINTRFPLQTLPGLLKSTGCGFFISNNDRLSKYEGYEELVLLNVKDFHWNTEDHTGSSRWVISPDQPATIIFSSGSTGVPKGILHSFGNHYYSALGSNQNITLGQGDQWILSLPPFSCGRNCHPISSVYCWGICCHS